MNFQETTTVALKLSVLVLVLSLLIGHGSQVGPIHTEMREGPCATVGASIIPLDANLYCIDDQDTVGDIAQVKDLTTVDGYLAIYNTNLQSLDFLVNIKSITGGLFISHNEELTQLPAPSSLEFIGNLEIVDNPKLNDLSGLSNVTRIPGYVYIYRNPVLPSLSGFSAGMIVNGIGIGSNSNLQDLAALRTVTKSQGDVSITDNNLSDLTDLSLLTSVDSLHLSEPNIEYLTGLENLSTINKLLFIYVCDNLKGLDGLNPTLSYTELVLASNPLLMTLNSLPPPAADIDRLVIDDHASLTDISALANVSIVQQKLHITDNSSLTTLQGLENLTYTRALTVTDNLALTSVEALANVHQSGDLDISRNNSLTTLGMATLEYASDFTIQDNPLLCEQDAIALKDQLANVFGVITINGNDESCAP
jgi:hypothetical protein